MKAMCTRIDLLPTFPVTEHFPFGPVNLITLSDPDLPAPAKPVYVQNHLHLVVHDIDEPMPGFFHPTADHARQVWDFYQANKLDDNLLVACTAAAGRSQAVLAALSRAEGTEPVAVYRNATYNRLLYRLVIESAGGTVPPEPLVSMVVRLKYPSDRCAAFFLSMDRQRWKNWEIVFVADGPLFPGYREKKSHDQRVRFIETQEKLGRWGHPHRQKGIDAARGEYIGLSNDDNYYVPGYLDQMVYALESQDADLALCDYLAHYRAYQVIPTAPEPYRCDLGCWLARAALVRATPWTGTDFTSDGEYVARLAAKANKVAKVDRPLFVHN